MSDCIDDEYDSDSDHFPFFADATLDIDEARGIARTPDNLIRSFTSEKEISKLISKVQLPNINNDDAVSSPCDDSSKRQNGESSSGKIIDNVTETFKRDFSVSAIYNNQIPILSSLQTQVYTPKRPSRARDTGWLCGFVISLFVLFLPFFLKSDNSTDDHRLELADFPLLLCLCLAIIIARIFYTSRGGGEGEDQRYFISRVLIVSNATSCIVLPLLTLTTYYLKVGVKLYAVTLVFLIGMTLRELYIFAKLYRSDSIFVEGVNDSERAFFRMMVDTSLDVISRAFGRKGFFRTVIAILMTQFLTLIFLRKGLEYAFMCRFAEFWICMIVIIGYWCTNAIIHFLVYIICGGVISWFTQQGLLANDFNQTKYIEKRDHSKADKYDDFELQESYFKDDYMNGDLDEYEFRSLKNETEPTIRRFVITGLRYSLGSIVRCALVGDVARFLWFFNLAIDNNVARHERMNVGETRDSLVKTFGIVLKAFVRNNHDLGLCHVASYYSGYTKGSNDVISLIEFSGIEPILQKDLTRHMCASISKSISGLIAILVGYAAPKADKDHLVIFEALVVTYVICYAIIYTVVEPLHAGIRAVFVGFAINEQIVRRNFPLVHSRLTRVQNERGNIL